MRQLAIPWLVLVAACSGAHAGSPAADVSNAGGGSTSGGSTSGGSTSGGSTSGGSTSGGFTSGGFTSGGSTSSAGSSGGGGANVPVVRACDALPAPGMFENITPQGVGTSNFTFAMDPSNAGVVYLGTDKHRFWKTTDCGATWLHISTGKNGAAIDSGMNWTVLVDPVESNVIYTNAGYGSGTNGAYKSSNGGVDWERIWPPPDGALAGIVDNDFVNVFAMDPADHRHLLLTFHAVCKAPYRQSCIAESKDAGATFRLANGDAQMVGTEGQVIYFLDTPETWIWASQTSDFWRTENSGATWIKISPALREAHPQGTQNYRAKDGTFYLASADGLARSADGKTWALIPNTGPLAGGIVGDGRTLYMSNSFYWNWGKDLHPYFSAPESAGAPWTQLPGTPSFTAGGSLALDPSHRVLYSSNLGAGFWRVVVP